MDTTFLHGGGLEHIGTFATSLAIGLLIGIERERSPAAKAGLRTFALTALFGTMSAMLSSQTGSPWALAMGLLVTGIGIVAAYLHHTSEGADYDPGTTTISALLVCFGLGAMVWFGYQTLAIMLSIVTTILLYFKPELQGVSKRLTRRDLVSMLQFAVLTFIVLPVLPNQNYGPYATVNPHQVWLMVVLISGVSLAGYVALQLVGRRYGAPLLGFLGGMVSSTATTLVYARYGKQEDKRLGEMAVAVILIANLVVMIRLGLLGVAVSPRVVPHLLPVLGLALASGVAVTVYWWRSMAASNEGPVPEISNPTELRTALTFGLIYAAVLFLSAWLTDVAGTKGLYAVALVSGLTDVDAITLSSLRLLEQGKLATDQAVTAIALATLANLVFKFGLISTIGGRWLSMRCLAGMAAIGAGLIAGLIWAV